MTNFFRSALTQRFFGGFVLGTVALLSMPGVHF